MVTLAAATTTNSFMAQYLVTAGPTWEALDPVRFLSNRSSGRMGFALAAALQHRGHEVVLVHGPVALTVPTGVRALPVESALEMLAACQSVWSACDGVFAVAAVADYRPKEPQQSKIKRHPNQGLVLELAPNPDILGTLAAVKGSRLAVGFALETEHGEAEAWRKLEAKNLDFLVLNGPEAQGAEQSQVQLFAVGGKVCPLGPLPKDELAAQLLQHILPADS